MKRKKLLKNKKQLTVYIDNLQFKTIIGILPFEREKKQLVIVNLSFDYIFDPNSSDFIDYSLVAKMVKKTMKKGRFKLIEDAILTIESKLEKKFNLLNLSIKISKPTILKDCVVSVGI